MKQIHNTDGVLETDQSEKTRGRKPIQRHNETTSKAEMMRMVWRAKWKDVSLIKHQKD